VIGHVFTLLSQSYDSQRWHAPPLVTRHVIVHRVLDASPVLSFPRLLPLSGFPPDYRLPGVTGSTADVPGNATFVEARIQPI